MRHISSNDEEIYRRKEENDERQQRKQGKTWYKQMESDKERYIKRNKKRNEKTLKIT